ncbi:hypothetical protein BC628DRAFT_740348 [Trametes gibbosa]|nr:hypothetical protein BC628DRAFT_740348 [Trametes gibbosa]
MTIHRHHPLSPATNLSESQSVARPVLTNHAPLRNSCHHNSSSPDPPPSPSRSPALFLLPTQKYTCSAPPSAHPSSPSPLASAATLPLSPTCFSSAARETRLPRPVQAPALPLLPRSPVARAAQGLAKMPHPPPASTARSRGSCCRSAGYLTSPSFVTSYAAPATITVESSL